MSFTTYFDPTLSAASCAVLAVPAATHGIPTGDGTWRFAVELLVATGGARVGVARVGVATVSEYSWYDATPWLVSATSTRGKTPSGGGYPKPETGRATLLFANDTHQWSAWNQATGTVTGDAAVSTTVFNRELTPRGLMRVVMFQPSATTSASTAANGFTTISRTDFVPLFTGLIESTNEVIEMGRNMTSITIVDTSTALGAVQKAAVGAVGSGETLIQRVKRLTTDAAWPFPIVNKSGSADFDSASYTLTSTTMAANRMSELRDSAMAVKDAAIYSDVDGSLAVGFPPELDVGAAQFRYPSGTMIRLTNNTKTVSTDAGNFPSLVTAYYQQPLKVDNDATWVINYVAATNPAAAGAAAQVAQTSQSQGLYGFRGDTKTTLLGTTNAMALDYATAVVTNLDGWADESLPAWPLCSGVSQVIQPGTVTIQDQQSAQRAMVLGGQAYVDIFRDPVDPAPGVRMHGRMVQKVDKITPTQNGIKWSTDLTILSNYNCVTSDVEILAPSMPTGVSTSVLTLDTLRISWTYPAGGADGMEISKTIGGVTTTRRVGYPATYWDDNCGNNVSVSYVVKAYTSGGYSGGVSTSGSTPQLANPTGLTTTTKAVNVVQVGWTWPALGTFGFTGMKITRGASTFYVAYPGTSFDDTCGTDTAPSYTLQTYNGSYLSSGVGVSGSTYCGSPSAITMDGGYATDHTNAYFSWSAASAPPASGYYAIYLDGVLQITVSLATLNTGVYIGGLSNSAHTLTVRLESSYAGATAYGNSTARTLNIGAAAYSTPYDSASVYVAMCRNVAGVINTGDPTITITSMDVSFQNEGFSASLWAGTATRKAQYIIGGVTGADVGSKSNPNNETLTFAGVPGNTDFGAITTGTGWNTTFSGFWSDGYVTIHGTKAYPAINNS